MEDSQSREWIHKFKTNPKDSICIPVIPEKYLGVDTLSVYGYIFSSILRVGLPGSLLSGVETPFYVLTCVGFFIVIREGKGSISYLQGAVDSTPVGVFEQALPLFIQLIWWGYFLDLVLCLYPLRFPYTKTQSGILTPVVGSPNEPTRKSKGE